MNIYNYKKYIKKHKEEHVKICKGYVHSTTSTAKSSLGKFYRVSEVVVEFDDHRQE